jgi:predicted MFS family arabinose efflux permease
MPSLWKSFPVKQFKNLLHNQAFMCLWISQMISQLGDRAVFVLFVAVLTCAKLSRGITFAAPATGAAELTSWLYVAFTIPAVSLSSIAGVYVDRLSSRFMLIVPTFARAVLVLMLGLPVVSNSPISIYMLAGSISIASQFFGPTESASIPRLVPKDQLYQANSLFFTTMMLALGFGFAVGEPVVSKFGVANAHLAIAAAFLVACIPLLFIPDHKPTAQARQASWFEDLSVGFKYIFSNQAVFRAIVKITILFSTIITLNIVAVGLAQQVLHIQPFQFGYLVATAGLGLMIGNFVVGSVGHHVKPSELSHAGFMLLGIFLSALGCLRYVDSILSLSSTHSGYEMLFGAALLLIALTGGACAMVAIPTQSGLQATVPETLRGKVFGAQITAMSAASMMPVVLAGIGTDNLPGGVSTTLLLMGIPAAAAGAYFLFVVCKARELKRQ